MAHKGKKYKPHSIESRTKQSFKTQKEIRWVVNEKGCHLCVSHKPNKYNGYLMVCRNKKSMRMNRYIYEQNFGKIPEGMVIRHTCDVRNCINPKHLILGTQSENMKDRNERNRQAKGEINRHKLTKMQVLEILNSKEKASKIARKYNVTKRHINLIRKSG